MTHLPWGLLNDSTVDPGHTGRTAEERQSENFAGLTARYNFAPLVVATTGVFGLKTLTLLEDLGRQISRRTGDTREFAWLLQRIAIAIARGNALCLLANNREELG